MIWTIAIMVLGIVLSMLAAAAMWRQFENGTFSFGKLIFLVWLPGTIGGLLVLASTVLLVARLIKGM
jgi:hypothetical protein